ncbi:MAG: tripartite tricarboxylate transporter substrate binding protein [Rhodocyclales bacterium GT-UBC]|nr:MAG: tripartite tricarboxylate transporter substrate binding protein [Rhodocyclales bacterium GT-UBC]
MNPLRRTLLKTALAGAGLGLTGPLLAAPTPAAFPGRTVKVIVPYPAGGVVDVVTRIVTEHLSSLWGQPVIVESRPGANGNIGADAVRTAPPDGHTLLVGSLFLAVNPLLDKNAKVSPRDFAAIGSLGMPPNLLVVPAASPVRTLKEFVALAKRRPGELNAANPGVGSSNHLGTEIFQAEAGIDLNLVGYKGQPPFIPDLFNGQLDFAFVTVALAATHIRSGKLRPLAVSYSERLKSFPEIPTVAEAGYPQSAVLPWNGLFAPAGTPAPVLARIAGDLERVLKLPDVQQRYDGLDAVNPGLQQAAFERFVSSEESRWRRVITERKIKPE